MPGIGVMAASPFSLFVADRLTTFGTIWIAGGGWGSVYVVMWGGWLRFSISAVDSLGFLFINLFRISK